MSLKMGLDAQGALSCSIPAKDTVWAALMPLVSPVCELPCSGCPRLGPWLHRDLSRHISGLLRTAGLGTSGMCPQVVR